MLQHFLCNTLSFKDCLPPFIEDAYVTNKKYRPGDSLIISCHEGFQIRYPDTETMESVCQADGTWDNQPTCQGLTQAIFFGNYSKQIFSVTDCNSINTTLLKIVYIWKGFHACPLSPQAASGRWYLHHSYMNISETEFSVPVGDGGPLPVFSWLQDGGTWTSGMHV